MRRCIMGLIVSAAVAAPASAQTLARRIETAPDGWVAFSFAARPGICGDGEGFIRDGRHVTTTGWHNRSYSDDGDDRSCPCQPGPVRVGLEVRSHRLVDLETTVGGSAAPAGSTDLGSFPVAAAVDYLLGIAKNQADEIGKDAIFATTLADSIAVWPQLLALAKNPSVSHETRRSAVFWVSQAAGDAATRGLDSLASDERGDRDIREQAVFALSQRPQEEGVPALIRIARTNKDPEIRRKALFWLGQSDDPRALALFEEILTRR
jgi:hypothetical protein